MLGLKDEQGKENKVRGKEQAPQKHQKCRLPLSLVVQMGRHFDRNTV